MQNHSVFSWPLQRVLVVALYLLWVVFNSRKVFSTLIGISWMVIATVILISINSWRSLIEKNNFCVSVREMGACCISGKEMEHIVLIARERSVECVSYRVKWATTTIRHTIRETDDHAHTLTHSLPFNWFNRHFMLCDSVSDHVCLLRSAVFLYLLFWNYHPYTRYVHVGNVHLHLPPLLLLLPTTASHEYDRIHS